MSKLLQVQVILQASSGIVADHATNTFHFYTPLPGVQPDVADNILDMIDDFYNKEYNSQWPVAAYMSNNLSQTALVKMYDLGEAKPRVPWYEGEFTLNRATTGRPLPQEVALVASFQAPRISGQRQSRRRNRVYIGPLNEAANGSNGRPSTPFITAITTAAGEMKAAADASLTWQWRVFSPTDQQSHLVDNGWVDNAFDTQRRRGVAPSVRSTWS